eukprot:6206995-Pleurochrysis_carterae.AAC.1
MPGRSNWCSCCQARAPPPPPPPPREPRTYNAKGVFDSACAVHSLATADPSSCAGGCDYEADALDILTQEAEGRRLQSVKDVLVDWTTMPASGGRGLKAAARRLSALLVGADVHGQHHGHGVRKLHGRQLQAMRESWLPRAGAYIGGGELEGSPVKLTLAEAQAKCAADARCAGFTYNELHWLRDPHTRVHTHLMRVGNGGMNTDIGWTSHLKPSAAEGAASGGGTARYMWPIEDFLSWHGTDDFWDKMLGLLGNASSVALRAGASSREQRHAASELSRLAQDGRSWIKEEAVATSTDAASRRRLFVSDLFGAACDISDAVGDCREGNCAAGVAAAVLSIGAGLSFDSDMLDCLLPRNWDHDDCKTTRQKDIDAAERACAAAI